jgi:hypothetical protein
MATMHMVSAERFLGVRFHLRRCPQGVASILRKKTTIFGSQRSKLDHLTVCLNLQVLKFLLIHTCNEMMVLTS